MKPSELKISISVESYDENTTENYRNCYIAEKRIVSKQYLGYRFQILDLIGDYVKISRPYISYFLINK